MHTWIRCACLHSVNPLGPGDTLLIDSLKAKRSCHLFSRFSRPILVPPGHDRIRPDLQDLVHIWGRQSELRQKQVDEGCTKQTQLQQNLTAVAWTSALYLATAGL